MICQDVRSYICERLKCYILVCISTNSKWLWHTYIGACIWLYAYKCVCIQMNIGWLWHSDMDVGACICICLYSDEYRIIMTHQCWRLLSILVACGWMPSLIGLSVIMSKIRICIKGEKMPHGASWPTLAAVPSSCSSKRSSPWLLAYFLSSTREPPSICTIAHVSG